MSSVTIITLLIHTLFLYSNAASPSSSVISPFLAGSRSLLRSIDSDESEKHDYAVDLNATNFDSVLSETPATYAIVEFFAHWFVAELLFLLFFVFIPLRKELSLFCKFLFPFIGFGCLS